MLGGISILTHQARTIYDQLFCATRATLERLDIARGMVSTERFNPNNRLNKRLIALFSLLE